MTGAILQPFQHFAGQPNEVGALFSLPPPYWWRQSVWGARKIRANGFFTQMKQLGELLDAEGRRQLEDFDALHFLNSKTSPDVEVEFLQGAAPDLAG